MKQLMYLSFLSVFILGSCVSQKNSIYVYKAKNSPNDYILNSKKAIQIEPFDNLYINVTSLDQQGYNFFSKGGDTNSSTSELTISLISYAVSDSGFVTLPVLGKVLLKGKTLEEAAAQIKELYSTSLNNPSVTVKFVSNYITVLGTVRNPGSFVLSNEKINIFRALGLAGDITEYGNRKKVILLREDNKVVKRYTIDLTQSNILSSDFYYLHPSDIIYVEPLKARRWGMEHVPFDLLLSSMTTFLLFYQIFKK
jgi:polysaccharide biosynthesis/export protein